jgi:hypothetical protein
MNPGCHGCGDVPRHETQTQPRGGNNTMH